MTDKQQGHGPSAARETLRQLLRERDGIGRGEPAREAVELPEGAAPGIGSMAFPPCQCPRCR
ncbi:hypothetical protein AB0903_20445 [Streptomyces sp. NPDC048389]|uniref:hypothetical protein n=1 Tax=Streptomyces sp. NPDC048389 TaxID=3154622 RepID=UPI0034537145